jgi:hypothetical protein
MIRSILPPRPLLPDAYEGRIADAQLVAYPWRVSEANPDGMAARIGVAVTDEDGPAHVFGAYDASNREQLAAIFACCGLEAPASPEKSLEQLIGRKCRVLTRNIKPRQGKHSNGVKAVIASWLTT